MRKLFGTDGVRGIANIELTPELAFKLGQAGSFVLAQQREGTRPRIIVGKDTRISGDMLEGALIAGICSMGADALKVGVIPTPAVANLTGKYKATCGIVISASHNPVEDNGIKFFGAGGFKLPDEVEAEIEHLITSEAEITWRPRGIDVGRTYEVKEAQNNYLEYLCSCLEQPRGWRKMTVVLDCANGAAYESGPQLWRQMGVRLITINDQPNGININKDCGSTYPGALKNAVMEYNADIGIAYDGDADRCIVIDEEGNELDGDHILLICARDMKNRGGLTPAKIVATVMSNIGLNIALARDHIAVESCSVGDRYVVEKMKETKALLGGEQSGHIIFRQHANTGDGLLTSLKIAEVMQRTDRPLSELARELVKQPQLLVNVRINPAEKDVIMEQPLVKAAIQEAEQRLGSWGKLVVRPSGTEPLFRIMAQGPDQGLLEELIRNIKNSLEKGR